MVTADRPLWVRRAVRCFQWQTWPHRELVVLDDGQEDLSPILAELPPEQVRYERLRGPRKPLGALRNLALELATGDYCIQWDDDDWYHPDRIRVQMRYALMGYEAVLLGHTLMHLDVPLWRKHPFRAWLPHGTPGTILHRRDLRMRYPEWARQEDTAYRDQWRSRRVRVLGRRYAYLFIRCYHGRNTWDLAHFLVRLRNHPLGYLAYWYARLRGSWAHHPAFRLSPQEQLAFAQFERDTQIVRQEHASFYAGAS
ncbi:MAG: glycosyltransferase family 2 protein [Bacteroidetes bacterium]|nr:glycosyltransferase family 2 protein [Rhodothermia bacterium]MCS7154704.1 glycosyltransferase family 2 protein [Bacteroidota bacterium]MCX7907139.1 glycosyltransferase family 2 protein [Bacteroidota bacterium]MDW8137497.1 glycosyltransferase family A protein [Bacteroidota bacterium]MDW8285549.1 glycosyltransferase family A protein [Bacteroidota bacterium]